MIVLTCPHCGPRDVGEFAHLGEVVVRPDPQSATPQEWRAYLYLRENRAGPVRERWLHRAGCRRLFDAERDTRDNEVAWTRALGRSKADTSPPTGPEAAPETGPDPTEGGAVR